MRDAPTSEAHSKPTPNKSAIEQPLEMRSAVSGSSNRTNSNVARRQQSIYAEKIAAPPSQSSISKCSVVALDAAIESRSACEIC